MKYRLIFAYSGKTATIVQYLERIKKQKNQNINQKKNYEQIFYEE